MDEHDYMGTSIQYSELQIKLLEQEHAKNLEKTVENLIESGFLDSDYEESTETEYSDTEIESNDFTEIVENSDLNSLSNECLEDDKSPKSLYSTESSLLSSSPSMSENNLLVSSNDNDTDNMYNSEECLVETQQINDNNNITNNKDKDNDNDNNTDNLSLVLSSGIPAVDGLFISNSGSIKDAGSDYTDNDNSDIVQCTNNNENKNDEDIDNEYNYYNNSDEDDEREQEEEDEEWHEEISFNEILETLDHLACKSVKHLLEYIFNDIKVFLVVIMVILINLHVIQRGGDTQNECNSNLCGQLQFDNDIDIEFDFEQNNNNNHDHNHNNNDQHGQYLRASHHIYYSWHSPSSCYNTYNDHEEEYEQECNDNDNDNDENDGVHDDDVEVDNDDKQKKYQCKKRRHQHPSSHHDGGQQQQQQHVLNFDILTRIQDKKTNKIYRETLYHQELTINPCDLLSIGHENNNDQDLQNNDNINAPNMNEKIRIISNIKEIPRLFMFAPFSIKPELLQTFKTTISTNSRINAQFARNHGLVYLLLSFLGISYYMATESGIVSAISGQ